MDTDAAQAQYENEMRAIEQYLEHPLSKAILKDSEEQQEAIISLLCNNPITNVETFFAHFEAIGHLRGLRRAKVLIEEAVENVKTQLKETV